MLNEDYRDILQHLLARRAKFLLVGAYAMGAHGYPRATGDLDLWVEPSPENSMLVYEALSDFGAPKHELTPQTFSEPGIVFQIGVAPRRIDILTRIEGVSFQEAYANREEIDVEGIAVPLLSKPDLIRNKEATGRDKDRLDAENLRKHHQE